MKAEECNGVGSAYQATTDEDTGDREDLMVCCSEMCKLAVAV
jgi:NADH:ubiquinone oxidoreductase subunit E